MDGRVVIFGYGPAGKATAERLTAEGREVVVAQRREPAGLPKAAAFVACDALDRDAVVAAARLGGQFVVAIGFAYNGAIWRQAWPRAIGNFVAASEATGARMVFIDNLYMYGPQTAPLVETMPLAAPRGATPLGVGGHKPEARAATTRIWMDACAEGRARVAALRAPDFYGPGAGVSYLGDPSIGRLATGKRAIVLGSPDQPHDYAYVPDIGRAAATLLAAPDSAFGQAWHVPCAPTRTTREILRIAAGALGQNKLKLIAVPEVLIATLGIGVAFLAERSEMRFTFDRPYRVDASKFINAFWADATPFEEGVEKTALAYVGAAKASPVR
ncbi:nucleoside-diphosphate-sugar epimerase [Roseiarcus fermentans]|uniref:Nucleoside-diphosphate-sugar epimerase n=1 Tax=Roseiarcus fermentans TaxID=1473586 RepID=A0A366FB95_9HYPH|nr:NAD-dependent epimerase/dehydratase family protein [Roseiarcus fermentans]RBP11932.1 nucleoside-diphosphate-sugar epimerase [Roseiarcus fermentans]